MYPQITHNSQTKSLDKLAERLFSPNLKPRRVVAEPIPTSLAASRLPPPCAELDERPTRRARRFKLWRDNAPDLRLVVLDPRRRGHLRRYQSYAVPADESFPAGVRAIPVVPPLTNKAGSPAPTRPLVLPRTPLAHLPSAKIPKAERKLRYQRRLQFLYALNQEHERRFRLGMLALMSELKEFEAWNFSITSGSCVSQASDKVQSQAEWDTRRWGSVRKDIDLGRVEQFTQFFQDIRKKSTNIFHHLRLRNIPIYPVPRREEVQRVVKAENLRRQKNNEKRDAKRASLTRANVQGNPQAVRPLQRVGDIPDSRRAGELDELDALRAGKTIDSIGSLVKTETTDSAPDQRGSPALPTSSPRLRVTARLTMGEQDGRKHFEIFTMARPGSPSKASSQAPGAETPTPAGKEEVQPTLKALQTKLRDAEFQTELVKQLLQIMTNSQRNEGSEGKETHVITDLDSVEGLKALNARRKHRRTPLRSQSRVSQSRPASPQSDGLIPGEEPEPDLIESRAHMPDDSMNGETSMSSESTALPATEDLVPYGELNMDEDTHQISIANSPAASSKELNASSVQKPFLYTSRASNGTRSYKRLYTVDGDTVWDDDSEVDTLL